MNILVIFTGGTIGSSVLGKTICTNNKNSFLLLDLYSKRSKDNNINFDTIQPYYALSENNTGKEISKLIECVKENLNKNYDGIIVTHGTDTLMYSSSAISYAVGSNTIPIMLVSSNYVLTDKKANGLDNFYYAVEFIKNKCGNGVFVSYKNTNDKPFIHRGTRILAHNDFSDSIYSIDNQFYGYFENDNFIKNENYKAKKDEINPFNDIRLNQFSSDIQIINQYVGFKYPQIDKNSKAVIIRAYHSGTLCTDNDNFKEFAKDLKNKNIPCYIAGAKNGTIYESAVLFKDYNFKILPFATWISQYIKLWFAINSNYDFEKIINLSLGEDIL